MLGPLQQLVSLPRIGKFTARGVIFLDIARESVLLFLQVEGNFLEEADT